MRPCRFWERATYFCIAAFPRSHSAITATYCANEALEPFRLNSPIGPVCAPVSSAAGPWTNDPTCITPQGKENPSLCAYSAYVHGQSAIAVVTTATIASTLGDVFQSRDPAWGHTARPESPFWNPPYEVKVIAGKGKGMVANRTIRRDEIILEEHPTILELSIPPEFAEKEQLEELRRDSFTSLPPRVRAEVLDLARNDLAKDPWQDIFATNSFVLPLKGVAHSGVFRRIARINHSCRPNSSIHFDRTPFAMRVRASQDINPGEEITLSYIVMNQLSYERKQHLAGWGFTCSCPLCTSPVEDRQSDIAKTRLRGIISELSNPHHLSGEAVLGLARQMMSLVQSEAMFSQVGVHAFHAAKALLAVGDEGNARLYAEKAVEGLRRHAGGWDSEVTEEAEWFLWSLKD